MTGPTAARLAELLAGSGRTRVPRAAVLRAFAEADPTSAGSVDRRRRLAAALAELAAAGTLTPSRATDDGDPPLPQSVALTRTAPARPARPSVVWHPELSGAAALRTPPEVLLLVNRWLFAGGARAATVPLRERALEVTGDEKAFDGHLHPLLSPALLRAHRVVLPLHRDRLPGGGPVLLVVENADTFHSLRAALRPDPGPVGAIAWGAGNAFVASVLSLRDDPPAAIRYFGDLDGAGLRVPARASRLAESGGLPGVRPAAGLYRTLLAHGRPAPATAPADPVEVAAWLPAELRSAAAAVLAGGRRVAQEAVGQVLLAAGDGWRDGLGPD